MGKRARMGWAAWVAVLVLAGCQPGAPTDQATAPPATPKPATAAKPATPAGKQLKMAAIVFQADQFFQLVLHGMKETAKANNIDLSVAITESNPGKEAELIGTYTSQKVDAIIISPLNKTGSVGPLRKAVEQGIPVITCNTPLDADFPAAYIECSPADLGKQTGQAARDYITKHLGGQAKVLVCAFDSQVPEQSKARVGGFKEALKGMPGVSFVAQQDAWLADKAVDTVTQMLTAHPEANLLYAANEGGTEGATIAVKNAGRSGKVAVFGTDSSVKLLSYLEDPDNILQAITSQKPVEVGKLAVEAAIKALKKEPVEKKTYLEGILLTRTDPKGVAEFAKQLQAWTAATKG